MAYIFIYIFRLWKNYEANNLWTGSDKKMEQKQVEAVDKAFNITYNNNILNIYFRNSPVWVIVGAHEVIDVYI